MHGTHFLPEETQPASSLPRQESSPHPVKPLTTTASQGKKKEGRRRMDVEKQQAASDQQAALLEKHEAELKKIKAQVRDLEDYIDKLLVQIMEQTPTLLQVRSRHK
ncbi:hypothetical protein J4Q44_G00306370 [Coregonus suidteri]|uniref:FIP-RBD domain-containing protein n=1 Tax=Coregonus suidteri TaxID=861788 RepID=A0AAN8KX33_9TELE